MPASPSEQLEFALRFLAEDGEHSDACWQVLHQFLANSYDRLADEMQRHVPEDRIIHLASLLLILVARPGFLTFERRTKLFEAAQAMGIHVMPAHFYSPVPDTSKIPDAVWQERYDHVPGWTLNAPRQLILLQSLGKWNDELFDIPQEGAGRGEYFWTNPAFSPGDAAAYYAMIREFRPARLIEAGCGYSTLIAAKACLRNGSTALHCVEPYPPAFLDPLPPGVASLTKAPVQELPLDQFEQLQANDILFIDTTHICQTGSDVNHLFLKVLPRLRPGVLVHVHDIFLPWEMSRTWVVEKQLFWNEQHLLLAFLLFNPSFEVLLANQYLAREHAPEFLRAFPVCSTAGGGSFWMRRI